MHHDRVHRHVIDRSDDTRGLGVKPGDNRLLVSWFATSGATMNSVDVEGRPAAATVGAERGHPVFSVDLELPRGATRTITFHLTEPMGKGAVTVLKQPLVRPLAVTIDDRACR
jgi:hypothetical protein